MKMKAFAAAVLLLGFGASSFAAPVFVAGPDPAFPFGPPDITFEGLVEGQPVPTLDGVIFRQDDGGTPQADNSPFLFAYDSSSGVGVLTGGLPSTPTTAGLIADFTLIGGQAQAGAFMSDTVPLGDYTITARGLAGIFLESFVVTAAQFPSIATPGCDAAAPWEASGNRCGVFVGFDRPSNDIFSIQFGPSGAARGTDAFSIDDLSFAQIPDPGTLLLLGAGLLGMGLIRRRKQ